MTLFSTQTGRLGKVKQAACVSRQRKKGGGHRKRDRLPRKKVPNIPPGPLLFKDGILTILMERSYLAGGLIIILLGTIITITVSARSSSFSLPPSAREIAPGLFKLGTALHKGSVVEGYAFVDYRVGAARPGGGKPGGNTCFAFLARDTKWKVAEPYVVNPANTEGLDAAFVTSNIAADIGKWEAAAGKNILGDGNITNDLLVADTNSPDNQNEVYFGDIDDPGAIAVTIVWGIFSGPSNQRTLVEWDQVYDQIEFNWSSAGATGEMDFENIATHELGHAVGMSHPSDSCIEETMYRFASAGETKKRDLNTGDIAGIKNLYK